MENATSKNGHQGLINEMLLDRPNWVKQLLETNPTKLKHFITRVLDAYANLIKVSKTQKHSTQAEADSVMLLQMCFTRANHCVAMLDGYQFIGTKVRFNPLTDPITVMVLIRSLYELLCTFEMVFVLPPTEETKQIAYYLFVAAGIKEGTNLYTEVEYLKDFIEKDKENLLKITKYIESTTFFSRLSEEKRKQILQRMSSAHPNYKVKFIDEDIRYVNWNEIFEYIGFKKKLMGDMYAFLSVNAHPTHNSLVRFSNLFHKNDNNNQISLTLESRLLLLILCVFYIDFCKLFQWAKDEFDKLPFDDKMLLDGNNVAFRGSEYGILAKVE